MEDIVAIILDRPRHESVISELRRQVPVKLISDGDVSAAIATAYGGQVDILFGIGGALKGFCCSSSKVPGRRDQEDLFRRMMRIETE